MLKPSLTKALEMQNFDISFEIAPETVPVQIRSKKMRFPRSKPIDNPLELEKEFLDKCPKLNKYLDSKVLVPSGFKELVKYLPKPELCVSKKEWADALAIFLSYLEKKSSEIDEERPWIDIPTESMRWIDVSWYKSIAMPLLKGTEKGPCIEMQDHDKSLSQSRKFRLSEKLSKRFTQTYEISSERLKIGILNRKLTKVKQSLQDPAISTLLKNLDYFIEPTLDEVIAHGKKLIREGHTKKDRRLVLLNKRTKRAFLADNGFKKVNMLSSMKINELFRKHFMAFEDHILIFKRFIETGWNLPKRQKCQRVSDSMTGMPGWIRQMFKVQYNGTIENLVEIDCVALHGNLLYTLAYDEMTDEERSTFLIEASGDMHTKIALYLNILRKRAKKSGLTYINHTIENMERSVVNRFYEEKIPAILKWLVKVKKSDHKAIAKILFPLESKIIWSTIEELTQLEIPAYQVFDSICVPQSVSQVAITILNAKLKEYNVPTEAKL